MYQRYLGILGAGAKRKGTPERKTYDGLRDSLSQGSSAVRLYARFLNAFLDAVDRFFGDARLAKHMLFPHAFGLKKPAPLWTAPAFDRCLLLALIYPVATIFIIWTVSAHDVGPAEAALGLKAGVPTWLRWLGLGAIVLELFTFWHGVRMTGQKSWLLLGIVFVFNFFVAVAGLLAVACVTVGVFLFIGALAGAPAFKVARYFSFLSCIAVAAAGLLAFAFGIAPTFVAAIPMAVMFAAAAGVHDWMKNVALHQRWHGLFLSLFVPAMILICLGAAFILSRFTGWQITGPLALFFGLLTFINAPFNWASLGLTRALLRRGLELGGWWPVALALVDAFFAAGIIALLAITMVIGVQAFDDLAVLGGGQRVLPLDVLFDGIKASPSAVKYWWLYALLLSSMIPSFINLMIGGASFICGVPGLTSVLLQFLPVGRAVPAFNRAWIALVLTVQVFLGAALGVAAQFLLLVGVIGYLLPLLGLELLQTARDIAAPDLPMEAWKLFGGK